MQGFWSGFVAALGDFGFQNNAKKEKAGFVFSCDSLRIFISEGFAAAAGPLLVGGCLGGCWGRQGGRLGPCLFGFVGLLSCFVLVCLVGVVFFVCLFFLYLKRIICGCVFHICFVCSWIVGAWRSLCR